MSLLMDALKKAEQDKKEAAKRLNEAQARTGGLDFESADPERIKTTGNQPAASGSEDKTETPKPLSGASRQKKVTVNLALEPIGPTSVSEMAATEAETEMNEVAVPALVEDITLEHADFHEHDEEKVKPATRRDQTFAVTSGLSLEKESTARFEDTSKSTTAVEHADTISESRISRTIVSAAQLAKDIGGGRDQPTPVAAQTIFTAIGASGTEQINKWAMFLGLCMAITVAAGALYYLIITPHTRDLSSPLVAKGIETDPNLPPVIEIPEEMSTGAIIGEELSVQDIPAGDTAQVIPAMESAVQEHVADEPMAAEPVATVIEGSGADTQEEEIAATITSSQFIEETIAPEGENTALPDKIEVEPEAIEISRSKSIDKSSEMINLAYAEYITGNYSVAETGYQNVLKETPDNRDALLGLAAISYRKGNLPGAYESYLNVLKLYPDDSVAKTALINLQSKDSPVKSESVVKLMLQENPKASFLYFALGNLYAAQSRWADAQQAFFHAYQLESDNPDYVYNLAVSLDHVGQLSTALDYYNAALELADKSQVNFNTASVITRIDALSDLTRSN